MQINSFKKQRNGLYKLILDNNEELLLYEDLILKYDLLIHKRMDKDLLAKILLDNQEQEVYYIALKYLKSKRRSQKEVYEYLIKCDFKPTLINKIIKRLLNQRYIDDVGYASSFLHDKIMFTNDGPNKIKGELSKKGVSSEIIDKVMIEYDPKTQEQKINKIINKQIKSNHSKSNNILRRKILNMLLNLGFDKDDINKGLMQAQFQDDSDIRQQEYAKLYKKLGKKYSGQELEYRIRQKMYTKGFSNEDD